MNKDDLRKRMLDRRSRMTGEHINEQSKIVIEKLKASPIYQDAKTVLFYMSKPGEVHTHDLVQEAFQTKRVVLPRLNGVELDLLEIRNLDVCKRSAIGILEPQQGSPIDIQDIDLVIVPGLAFDTARNRLGFGIGCYDRALKEFKGKKIALAFSWQIVDQLPIDEWDVPMDNIITPAQ